MTARTKLIIIFFAVVCVLVVAWLQLSHYGLFADETTQLSSEAENDAEQMVCSSNKIAFDMNEIDESGLRGPADGKVSVDYEFCLPSSEDSLQRVRSLDPEIRCTSASSGRIGC